MKTILIRGIENAGKSTTASLIYEELLKSADKQHYFDGNLVSANSLRYQNKELIDFIAILTVNSKIVVIISAGDTAWKLMIDIKVVIAFVIEKFNAQIDVLICCGKSSDKDGSVYARLLTAYPTSEIHQEWALKSEDKSQKNLVKMPMVRKIAGMI